MYRVYVNDLLIHDQSSPDPDIHMISPRLKMVDNGAGSFSFTLANDHVGYNEIELMKSTIVVKQDGTTIWTGRPIKTKDTFTKQRTFECEGALAYLNDTLQPNVKYRNQSISIFFSKIIQEHNKKVREDRRFQVGVVDVQNPAEEFEYETDYQSSMVILNELFINRLGGHISITYDDSRYDIREAQLPTPIINYKSSYNTSNQVIDFGKNLLDYSSNWDLSNLVTVIYPRGKQLNSTNNETITSSTYDV